jgi:AcrR family transcriptional regulator
MAERDGGTLVHGQAVSRTDHPWDGSRATNRRLPAGRHGLSREAVVSQQRARILGAIVEMVGRHGYQRVCVDLVTSAAGLSRRTFYDLYMGKEDCFLDAHARVQHGLLTRTDAELAEAGDCPWADRLAIVVDQLAGLASRSPAAAHVCVSDVLALGPRGLALREHTTRPLAQVIGESPGAPGPLGVEVAVGGVCRVVGSAVKDGHTAGLDRRLTDLVSWVGSER